MRTKRRRRRARAGTKRTNWLPLALLALGLLLLAGGVYAYISAPPTAAASTEYEPEDVAHEGAFVAVHEMGDGPPIPFLPRNQAQPEIQVPETQYDFGLIGPLDVVERTFIVRNIGQAPLTISRAYTTCGCTTAEISARVIPPGKVATINIIFDAGFHDTSGQTVRRGLIIENNDPAQSRAEIWFQAQVRESGGSDE